MNKNLKKIIVTGASLLMLASAGAGINNANASSYLYAKRNIRAQQVDFGNAKHPTRAYYDGYSRNVKRGSKIVYIRKLNHEYYLVDLYHAMGNYRIPRNAVSKHVISRNYKHSPKHFKYNKRHHLINHKRRSRSHKAKRNNRISARQAYRQGYIDGYSTYGKGDGYFTAKLRKNKNYEKGYVKGLVTTSRKGKDYAPISRKNAILNFKFDAKGYHGHYYNVPSNMKNVRSVQKLQRLSYKY